MKTQIKLVLLAVSMLTLSVSPLRAQIVADGATNTLSNVTTNITGTVTVGTNGSFTLLILSDNALLTNSANGVISLNATARSNEVHLISPTARWLMGGTLRVGSNGAFSRLVVSNGGLVENFDGILANGLASSNNVALVIGGGSIWSNRGDLTVGFSGRENQLIVSNGGRVANRFGYLGRQPGSSNNLARVTGSGSVWSNQFDLAVGFNDRSNRLIIEAGGVVSCANGVVSSSSSSGNNEVLVTGPGSLWSNRFFLFMGDVAGRNRLVVSNGATVWSGGSILGTLSPAISNQVIVTGPGSVWTNQSSLTLGEGSSGNRVDVNNGGQLACADGSVGLSAGANNNTVLLTGAGSTWNNLRNLIVGNSGSGNALITSNGATVLAGNLFVGFNSSAISNSATVTGPGTSWLIASNLYVGSNGAFNLLVVSNGASVTDDTGLVSGGFSGASNRVVVTDAGSIWNNRIGLVIGNQSGGSRLVVSNGGVVLNGFCIMGGNASSNNLVQVTGAGSVWSNALLLRIGSFGVGNRVVIENGARLDTEDASVGASSANNEAVITGAGSLWNNRDQLSVGGAGSGNRLVISNAAVASTVTGIVGEFANSTSNRVVVDGGTLLATNASGTGVLNVRHGTNVLNAGLIDVDQLILTNTLGLFEFNGGTLITRGAVISNGAPFVVGASGTVPAIWDVRAGVSNYQFAGRLIVGSNSSFNQVFITNGVVLAGTEYTFLAFNAASSNNAVVVAGPGSTLNSPAGFFVGADGNANRLVLTNGGKALANIGSAGTFIGRSTGTRSNVVLVADPGSRWSINDILYVGAGGNANQLVVSNGGMVNSLVGYVGSASGGSNNVATVTGANSSWSNRSELYVGASGTGNRLLVSDGATVINSNAYLGLSLSSRSNIVQVAGAGSLWNNRTDFFVGYDGTHNQLVVSNGAVVSVGGNLFLGLNPTTSTANRLVVDGGTLLVTNGAGTGLLEVKRGTNVLNAGLIEADILRMTNAQSEFEFQGGTLSVKSSRVSIGNFLSIGNGASPATFNLAGNGTHDFAGTLGLIVFSNATLTGNGSLMVQLQVRSGATFAPGASVGKISLSTPPFFSGTIVMELAKNGAVVTNDQVQVTGTVTYGGALIVTNLGPNALAAGDRFQLFNATAYAGSFTSISLPPLGPGLRWETNLLVDGSIEVFASPPVGAGFALNFDGTNDFVQSTADSRFNAYPLVATAWINTTQAIGEAGIINKYIAGSLNGWQVALANGEVRAWYSRNNGNSVGGGGYGLNGGLVNDGEWHHVAFTVDATAGRLYVDGFLKDTLGWLGTPGSCTTTQALSLARYPGGAGEFYRGMMDEVAVWNAEQTPGEIKTNLNRGLIGSEIALVLYHRLNKGTGVLAENASEITGSFGNGVLQNGVTWVPGLILRPAILTKIATAVTVDSATLLGVANPGLTNASAWFEWGTTAAYGNVTPPQPLGSGGNNTNFSQSITGLTENATYRFRAVASNVVGTSFGADRSFVATGTNMLSPRAFHTATLLSNGKVLVAGGRDQDQETISSAELFDTATGTWAFTSPMSTPRYEDTATLLPNGKVLVAGGAGINFGPVYSSAELYDPVTGTWEPTGSMATNRFIHTATLLSNGKVLVAGGCRGGACADPIAELYDPATGTWTETGALAGPRAGHTATLLPNGKVLVTGGTSNNIPIASAELYDPVSGTWALTGSMTTNRQGHTATLLRNGRVLAVGGRAGGVNYLRSAELYDPLAGTWTATGAMLNFRVGHTATLLPNGKVVASGDGIGAPSVYDPLTQLWTDVLGPDPDLGATATLLHNGKVLVAGGFFAGDPVADVELFDPNIGSWAVAAPMVNARDGHTATLLPDGRVLVASFNNSELYNFTNNLWLSTGALNSGRYNHSATLLPNGQVLAVGGQNSFGTPIANAELYTPSFGTWTNTGSLASNRVSHSATLLGNGKVLVAGGFAGLFATPYQDAELYDPAAGSWTNTGAMTTNRYEHSATLLPNGKVLVTGGIVSGSLFPPVTATAELFEPASGTWTSVAPMTANRRRHIAVLLPSGKVLVAGGLASTDVIPTVNSSAELFDPGTGTWQATGSMTSGRRDARATLLPSGKVLVTGGYNQGYLSSAELYDPGTGKWTATAALGAAHLGHTSTLLPIGRVLVTGGNFGNGTTNRAELYDVGLGFSNSWRPQIIALTSPLGLGGSLVITGAQFRGLSEGSGGNASQNSSTDYPLVQLRSLESQQTVFVLPTGWSTNSFNSAPVTGLPPGWAMATVFANGIPSVSSLLNLVNGATVIFSNLVQTYNGTARSVSVTTVPPGLPVNVTYNGSSNPPTNAGSYAVFGTVVDPNFQGSATNTLVVQPAAATVTLGNLSQPFTGTARSVSVVTVPPGLPVNVTYNGSPNAPTNPGSYTVVGTIPDPNYSGGATNTLEVIAGMFVNTTNTLRTVDARLFGINNAAWDGYLDTPATVTALNELGTRVLRWPGGSWGDIYHESSPPNSGWGSYTTNFIHVATNIHAQAFMIANYGTGTTNEAADWVRFVNITNNANFKFWEVGNECYGSWEADHNTNAPFKPHDAWTYATRFKDYFTAMKAVDPAIKIGIPVVPSEDGFPQGTNVAFNPRTGIPHFGWTPVVLNTLSNLGVMPDFAVDHFYAQFGNNDDAKLLRASTNWAIRAANLRQQLADYLGPTGTNVELVCTENNSDAAPPGKQTTSLVNGLYLADSFSQIMKTEFNAFLWWDFRNGPDTNGSFSPSLYGWRTNGDQGIILEADTRYPTFYAMKLMQHLASPGDSVLNPVSSDPLLAVYAAKKTNGAVNVLVINKDPTNTLMRPIALSGTVLSTVATVRSYGIPQDEAARTNAALALQDIATSVVAISSNSSLAFPPYSLTLFSFAPRDFGVDVSHFQNESGIPQSSWDQMFAEGKRFVFIKATEGLTGPHDATMSINVTRATAAGLLAGVYHYAHPENRPTTNGAILEASNMVVYAGSAIGPGRLRPVLDLESSAATLSTTALTDWAIAFCNEIVARRGPGAAPIIYCNQTFANNEFDSRLAGYDLWLRTVGSGANPAVDDPPGVGFADATGVFDNWSFWQYSATGSSGGISPLDLNVCHSDFKALNSFLIPNAVPATIQLTGLAVTLNGAFQFSFTNTPGATFTVLATTNASLPLGNWTILGAVTETSPGQYQFTDPQTTNNPQRYYRVRSP